MNMPGISSVANNQSVYRPTESPATQDGDSSSAGWKYLTVKAGDIIYTYIVIGKNMKILIGQTSAKKDEATDNTNKNADATQGAAGNPTNPAKPNVTCQNNTNSKKLQDEQSDFLTDHRMLALTGYYQKKIRDTIKNLENNIGIDKPGSVAASTKSGRDA